MDEGRMRGSFAVCGGSHGSFYQKMSRYNVFQYKISDRMSYLGALYDNFEFFLKKIFQWERNFENRGAVREISTDFQSENGFELTKDRRIRF